MLDLNPGTGSSNPFPSSGESANFRFLASVIRGERAFEPVEELRCGIDLVVVFALREDRHLVQVFGDPGCRLGNMDKAVLDYRGLRIQTHDLVACRMIAP